MMLVLLLLLPGGNPFKEVMNFVPGMADCLHEILQLWPMKSGITSLGRTFNIFGVM